MLYGRCVCMRQRNDGWSALAGRHCGAWRELTPKKCQLKRALRRGLPPTRANVSTMTPSALAFVCLSSSIAVPL